MGYTIRTIDGSITIPASKHAAALSTIQQALGISPDRLGVGSFGIEHIPAGPTRELYALLNDLGFEGDTVSAAAGGNLPDINIYSYSGKSTDDTDAFGPALAGFATAGDYLLWLGEEGEIWRWYYTTTTFEDQLPTVLWPGDALPTGATADLVSLFEIAQVASTEDSNDDEIEALWKALNEAMRLLGLDR